jgi:hypothetical protein
MIAKATSQRRWAAWWVLDSALAGVFLGSWVTEVICSPAEHDGADENRHALREEEARTRFLFPHFAPP